MIMSALIVKRYFLNVSSYGIKKIDHFSVNLLSVCSGLSLGSFIADPTCPVNATQDSIQIIANDQHGSTYIQTDLAGYIKVFRNILIY